MWGFVGAKAEQLPTMRTADRRARMKRFMLDLKAEGVLNRGQIELGGKASPLLSKVLDFLWCRLKLKFGRRYLHGPAEGNSVHAYLRVRVYNSTKWQQER